MYSTYVWVRFSFVFWLVPEFVVSTPALPIIPISSAYIPISTHLSFWQPRLRRVFVSSLALPSIPLHREAHSRVRWGHFPSAVPLFFRHLRMKTEIYKKAFVFHTTVFQLYAFTRSSAYCYFRICSLIKSIKLTCTHNYSHTHIHILRWLILLIKRNFK